MSLADSLRDPIALRPNRIGRFYRGGRMLDAFRGRADAADDDRPEDWVGSATRTWTPSDTAPTDLGLSSVAIGEEQLTLAAILRREPSALAGADLVARSGRTLGLLVKLLDAGERLPVHCHPTREAARRLLGSPFGKAEAWIILGTREPSPPPRIWAGFAEPVAPATLRGWIERQETDALLGALVEHEVNAGDAFLIPAGTPHAIGAGVFLLELQEPTDFSVVAETRGFPISPDDASLGLGWDAALGFFETDAVTNLRQSPRPADGDMIRLLGDEADPYFRALRVRVDGAKSLDLEPAFVVGIVLAGTGEIAGATHAVPLSRGTTFALPAAAVPHAQLRGEALEVILCLPPEPSLAPLAVQRGA